VKLSKRSNDLFRTHNGSSSKMLCVGEEQEMFLAMKSVVHIQWLFWRGVPGRNSPTAFTIKHLLEKLRETVSVQENTKGRNGRPGSVRTERRTSFWLWDNAWSTFEGSKEGHKTFVPGDT